MTTPDKILLDTPQPGAGTRDTGFPPHGGDLLMASILSGLSKDDIVDFSVSVNPLGLPRCVGPLMERLVEDLGKYPDSESSELKETLSQALGLGRERITVTNGSTELIHLLPALWEKGKCAFVVSPCFSEYERAFRLANVPLREWRLSPESGFAMMPEAFLHKLRSVENLGGVIVGHPNNPTGSLLEKDFLLALLNHCEERGAYLVVDETFVEFAGPEHSALEWAERSAALILTRSLTKFYSVPGLRLGYGITSPALANKIRERRPPWSVNLPAQKIGNAVLGDREYARASRECIRREREFLYEGLNDLHSLEAFPSSANFILFQLRSGDERQALDLYRNLLRRGLLVRNCGNFKGLGHCFFRVAVKKRDENEFLISSLRACLASCEH